MTVPQQSEPLLGGFFAGYVVVVGYFFTFLPFQFVYRAFHVPTYPMFAILLLVAVLTMYLLLARSAHRSSAQRALLVAALYLPFAGYALFSWLLTPEPQISIVGLVGVFILNPLFLLFAVVAATHARWAVKTMGIMGTIYIVAGLHALLSGTLKLQVNNFQSVFGIELNDGFEGAYQNESIFMGLGTVIAFSESMIVKNKTAKCALLLLAVCGVVLIFASGGRSAFIGIVVAFIVQAWSVLRRKVGLALATIAVLLIGYLAVMFLPIVMQGGSLDDSVLLRRFSAAASEGGAEGSRPYLFAKAVELWLSSGWTFLFGAGLGSYPAFIREWSPGMYPHNVALQMAAELGVVGTTLWLLPFLFAAADRPRRDGDHGPEREIWPPTLFLWATSMGSGDVGTVWMEVFLTMLWLEAGRTAGVVVPDSSWAPGQRHGGLPASAIEYGK